MCPVKGIVLGSIPTWTKYFLERGLKSNYAGTPERLYDANDLINEKVSHWSGDIIALEVDAVVNAANSALRPGGGVCGAIHRKAGTALAKELEGRNQTCPPGEAVITKGYNLPAKYVIHAVGPRDKQHAVLSLAYLNSLKLLISEGLRTIAFPCISTGVYGFPRESAAHVSLNTVRQFLEENSDKVDRVIFCTFLEEDRKIYDELMQRYFPTPGSLHAGKHVTGHTAENSDASSSPAVDP